MFEPARFIFISNLTEDGSEVLLLAKVYCLLGDGELQEGSCWEAFMNADTHKLNNVVAIIDRNRLQIDGNTEDIKALDNLKNKIASFNWSVIEIDGHNSTQIISAYLKAKNSDKPTAIIANTVKGRGVSFMENNPSSWFVYSLFGECVFTFM